MYRSCLLTSLMGLIIAAGIAFATLLPGNNTVELANAYDQSPTAFTFDYPEDWSVQIPQRGILIVGSPETMAGELGPSLVVRRSELLAGAGGLDAALDNYLDNGPLRNNRAWEVVVERTETRIGEREAYLIELEGSELPDAPQLHTRILAAKAGSGAIYFITFAAPLEDWEAFAPVFDAMLETMIIAE